jgi:hypothetical protein
MKAILIATIFEIFILYGARVCSAEETEITYTVKGIELIDDQDLKSSVLKYLQLREDLNYMKLYDCLSKNYLAERFPDINNADQYSNTMNDYSEISMMKYLEIFNVKIVDKDTSRIGIIYESISEEMHYKIKNIYVFVKEGNTWKYDGMDLESREILSQREVY